MSTSTYGLSNNFNQLSTRFDPSHEVLWTILSQNNRLPSFNYEIVREINQHHKEIEATAGILTDGNDIHKIKYSVSMSSRDDIFSLGGHLKTIRALSGNQQKEALADYAFKVLEVLIQRTFRFNVPSITTITLLQGQALGGGLEAALTSDVIIAERKSLLGFPEILFNMFPGMGGFSFAQRRVGTRNADKMITSGKMYTAEECYDMGLVDILVDDGEGEKAVYDFIRQNKNKSHGFLAAKKALNAVHPVTIEELKNITEIWIDNALKLSSNEFKMMDKLISNQFRRYEQGDVAEILNSGSSNVVSLKSA